jgi:hypothetical protein
MIPKPQKLIPRRFRHRGFMTIAAGFQFDSGILLCADTQYTGGAIKLFAPKLQSTVIEGLKPRDEVSVAIVFSGTETYMQMAALAVEDEIQQVVDHASLRDEEPNVAEFRVAIENFLLKFHHKHIYEHPNYKSGIGPSVSMVIGIQAGSSAILFRTNETAVEEIRIDAPCAFVGSGREIAEFAVRPLVPDLSEKVLTLDEAILLATHALRVAKQSDPNCGGRSDFIVLFDNGAEPRVTSIEIKSAEEYSKSFDRLLQRLFFSVADTKKTSKRLKITDQELIEIRTEQRELIRQRERLLRDLWPPKRRPSRLSSAQKLEDQS